MLSCRDRKARCIEASLISPPDRCPDLHRSHHHRNAQAFLSRAAISSRCSCLRRVAARTIAARPHLLTSEVALRFIDLQMAALTRLLLRTRPVRTARNVLKARRYVRVLPMLTLRRRLRRLTAAALSRLRHLSTLLSSLIISLDRPVRRRPLRHLTNSCHVAMASASRALRFVRRSLLWKAVRASWRLRVS